MNLLHLKYALEVEKTRSINKAAENLFIGQPTLSKSIKKLEESLGITLFIRTPTGIMPTADGERFLARAHDIMTQADELEAEYAMLLARPDAYALTLPRCPVSLETFARFTQIHKGDIKADFGEPERAVHNILQDNFDIAIIRYCPKLQPMLPERLNQEGLAWYILGRESFRLTYKGEHEPQPDSDKDMQVIFEDSPLLLNSKNRHALIRDIGGLMSLLEIRGAYSWLPPLNGKYNLKQLDQPQGEKYADMVIYKRGRVPTKIDNILLYIYCESFGYPIKKL